MTEEGDTLDVEVFTQNSERVLQQNELDIRVIVGNPPYSVGQKSANDNNANETYPTLDAHIAATYAANTQATNKNSLYNSYIRAFRWASDRIDEKGIVCFVSGSGWLDGPSGQGVRICFEREFDSIHIFNLRGDKEFRRLSKEQLKSEGDNIFASGSKSPIAITMLVKNPNAKEQGIFYHDIGDYLTREEKLDIICQAAKDGIKDWQRITPDRHNDWLNQRDDSWYEFAPLGLEKYKEPQGIFATWSCGLKTQRDPWAWGYSASAVRTDMKKLIEGMDEQIKKCAGDEGKLEYDAKRYSWTRRLLDFAKKGELVEYDSEHVILGMYRPFCKQYVYYDAKMNERTYQQPRLFPFATSEGKKAERTYQQPIAPLLRKEKGAVEMTYQQHSPLLPNIYIATTGGSSPSCMVSGLLPDLHFIGDSQCFPLYWYEKQDSLGGLFDKTDDDYVRHDAITDEALNVFRAAYPYVFAERKKKDGGEEIIKEDIFFYIYGILHSPEYRKRFATNLKKELPRIPLAENFTAFCNAGRELAYWHLNYEEADPYPLEEEGDSINPGRTEKIRFGKCKKDDEHPKGEDRTVLHVAENLTLRGIPEEVYNYVVNGKSAIGWLMDRYKVTTDKASGIVNDPNEYSDNPRYIVDLVKRVVRVSLETNEIVNMLPPLNERSQPANWPFAWKTE
ncbi:MAG TPA: hypothetical protein OIM11_03940 [Coriobacteriaceae bacterium]|nr:hypothetical protein [Coriobacteriaceae bacterium]